LIYLDQAWSTTMVATLEDIGAMRTKNDQDFVVVEE
jgi:hypothetical protein